MSIELAMIVRNEAEMLKKTLPVIAPCFRRKFALDTGSTDNTKEVLIDFGFMVNDYKWDWDFSAARNFTCDHVRAMGVDWIWFFDADEAMWPHDISRVKDCLDMGGALGFPRWNLIYDHRHWEYWSYPDIQNRLFRLDGRWSYGNRLHESLVSSDGTSPEILKDAHIFHYGSVKPIKQVWLKHHNYNLLKDGKQPLDELPENISKMSEDEFRLIYGSAAKRAEEFKLPNPLG